MKNALKIMGIVGLSLIGLSIEAVAQGRGQPPGQCLAALNLSAQQRQQIDQLRDAAIKQAEPLRAQMIQKMDELRNLWRADQLDKVAITQKQSEIDAIRARKREIWTDFWVHVHAVLTPEQRSKWVEWRGPGMGGGQGRGWRRGGPGWHGFGPGWGANPDCPMAPL